MKNLTQPRIDYRKRAAQPDLHTGCEGIVTRMPNGDEVRWHIGNNGWFYINGVPFGVGGMPPAPHANTHFTGGEDAIAPSDIGAASYVAFFELLGTVDAQADSIDAIEAAVATGGGELTNLTTRVDAVETVSMGPGTQPRPLVDRLRDFISVKDFGAVGDGFTDDTAAIQAALDSGHHRILFNDGYTFLISNTVVAQDNTVLYGGGWIVCNTPEMEMLELRGEHTTISLNLDGRNNARTGIVIRAGFGDNFVVEKCHIKNMYSAVRQAFGFVTWSDAPGVVRDNRIENTFSLGDNGGPSVAVGRSGGVQVSSPTAIRGSLHITGNTICNIYGEEGDSISVQIGSRAPFLKDKVHITNNILHNFSRRAVKLQVSGAIVTGNLCVSDDDIQHDRTSNVISVISCNDCSVTNNVIRANDQFVGVSVSGEGLEPGQYAKRNFVAGNKIYSALGIAVIVTDAFDTVVSGNSVYGLDTAGVGVGASPQTHVIGNSFMQSVVDTNKIIISCQSSPHSVIADNVINGDTIWRGIMLQSTNTAVVNNKILSRNITSAAFSGPGSSALENIAGSVIAGNCVRNASSLFLLNFGGAYTAKVAQNYIMGQGAMHASSMVFATGSSPAIATPTISFTRGNVAFNSNATAGQPAGWICVESGTPGIWSPFGSVTA